MLPPLKLVRTLYKEDLTLTRTSPSSVLQELSLWSQQVLLGNDPLPLLIPPLSSAFTRPPLQPDTMDTAAVGTLLALLMAMAGVSQALRIQGGLDKNDMVPGSSEENIDDRLLELVRHQTAHNLELKNVYLMPYFSGLYEPQGLYPQHGRLAELQSPGFVLQPQV